MGGDVRKHVGKGEQPTDLKLEDFKNTKGIIRIRKLKDKRTNNDLQNTTQKTNDLASRTPQKTGGDLRCSGRVSSCCSTIVTLLFTGKCHQHHLKWKLCLTPVNVNKYKTHNYKREPPTYQIVVKTNRTSFYTKLVADITTRK